MVLSLALTWVVYDPLQIWADLIPPSESPRFNHSQCSVPADSPLTDFNELALFDLTDGLRGCTDCETDASPQDFDACSS